MSKSSTMDLASGLGGMMKKEQVKSAVEQYEKYYDYYGGDEKTRITNYTDLANKYYDLSTSFYEFGWGESFHFAPRWNDESLRESLKRHEHFMALQLSLKNGMKVLDVGCGIGGPLREIARFSSTEITGLNNNEYQISRAIELNQKAGLKKNCNFVKADFMNIPIPNSTFDAIYAMDATCHAPDLVGCYKEIHRVLKPGQCFGVYEWCLTHHYDPKNKNHQNIKAKIEIGNGLPNIRTMNQCLDALKEVGFKIICEKDLAVGSPIPWYSPLEGGDFSITTFRLTTIGRFITRAMVKSLEFARIAPEGSNRVSSFLEIASDGLVQAGRAGIFTPMYFVLARKSLSDS